MNTWTDNKRNHRTAPGHEPSHSTEKALSLGLITQILDSYHHILAPIQIHSQFILLPEMGEKSKEKHQMVLQNVVM